MPGSEALTAAAAAAAAAATAAGVWGPAIAPGSKGGKAVGKGECGLAYALLEAVAELTRSCRPPSEKPFMCWMAFSAELGSSYSRNLEAARQRESAVGQEGTRAQQGSFVPVTFVFARSGVRLHSLGRQESLAIDGTLRAITH